MGLFDQLGSNSGFGSAPSYQAPAKIARPIQGVMAPTPAYTAPTPTLHYATPSVTTSPGPMYQAPVDYGQQGGSISQPGDTYGGGSSAPAAPVAPPPPKIDYGSADYLSGKHDSELDGTFHDQVAMYGAKLKKYIADYDSQAGTKAYGVQGDALKNAHLGDILGGSMGVDYNNAQQGIARNRDIGLRGVTEDFANRGMINSGLYNKDFGISRDQYNLQGQNLDQGTRNQLQTLDFNRANQETDNTANIGAARRDALNRLASSQTL